MIDFVRTPEGNQTYIIGLNSHHQCAWLGVCVCLVSAQFCHNIAGNRRVVLLRICSSPNGDPLLCVKLHIQYMTDTDIYIRIQFGMKVKRYHSKINPFDIFILFDFYTIVATKKLRARPRSIATPSSPKFSLGAHLRFSLRPVLNCGSDAITHYKHAMYVPYIYFIYILYECGECARIRTRSCRLVRFGYYLR